MKKILILGALNLQIQLIQAAKEQGYYVIACDYKNDNPGIPLVDKHYQVGFLDREAVLSVAKEEQIDGVISNTDSAMPIVAYIAEQLDLVGNPPECINNLVSKSAFRQMQEQADLYFPKHVESEDSTNVEERIKNFTFPIIVKPSACSSSRGTTKVYAKETEKLLKAFELCKQLSRDGKVTIEEYVEMPSLEVIEGDVFVLGDEILWNGIFTNRRSMMAPMVPMTYIFPAILTSDELSIIKKSITDLFKEAGIRHGEYNIEMYFTTQRELFIIEVNPRQAGNRIPQLIKQHTGIDFNKLLVTTAVGDNDYFDRIRNTKPKTNYLSQHVVFSNHNGVLEKVEINPAIRQYVTDMELTKDVGSRVNQRNNATDCIAYVTMEFPDRETQLTYSRDKIEDLIFPIVKN